MAWKQTELCAHISSVLPIIVCISGVTNFSSEVQEIWSSHSKMQQSQAISQTLGLTFFTLINLSKDYCIKKVTPYLNSYLVIHIHNSNVLCIIMCPTIWIRLVFLLVLDRKLGLKNPKAWLMTRKLSGWDTHANNRILLTAFTPFCIAKFARATVVFTFQHVAGLIQTRNFADVRAVHWWNAMLTLEDNGFLPK